MINSIHLSGFDKRFSYVSLTQNKIQTVITNLYRICFVFIFFFINACTQNNSPVRKSHESPANILSPVIVKAGSPIVVLLDTCPPPYYVVIPIKDSVDHIFNTSRGPLHRMLAPAPVKAADFFITMSNYNAENGLAINSVMSSYCDKRGVLWFGTNGGGLTRYDGNSSETISSAQGLGSNQVRCIAEDAQGTIWFAMGGGGVAKYDGRSITNFTTADGLAHNEARSVTIDRKGNIWFGTYDGGISLYNGNSFKTFTTEQGLASNKVYCSAEDNDGNIWFGTDGEGISRYDGKSFTNYTEKGIGGKNSVKCITKDSKGNLWFGTEGGVIKYDGNFFFNYTENDGLSSNSVHSIVEDKNGNMWFGTYDGGVSCYNGKSFFNISNNQGLANNVVRSIVMDKSGNLWFGTFGNGVNCYMGNSVVSFTTAQGLPNNKIWGIAEDSNNNLWFATDANGFCRYDGKSFTNYSEAQGLYNGNANCIFEDKKKQLWIGTNGGVSKFDGKSFTTYTTRHGLAGMNIRHIIEGKSGDLWFSSELGGISKFDGKFFATISNAQGLPDNDVRVILEGDNGGVWLGLHGGGISYYNGKSFTNFTTDQGLANNFVFTMIKDRYENIWIGTGNGGVSIMPEEIVRKTERGLSFKNDEQIFENFTTKEGLSDDAAYDVAEDSLGNIIVGTNLGLTVIKTGVGSPIKKITPSQIEYYHWKAGYPIKDINAESMYVDSKGNIWTGTGQKLIKFEYTAVHRNTNPPAIHIKRVRVGNENIGWCNLLAADKATDSIQRESLMQSVIAEESFVYGRTQDRKLRDSIQKKFADIQFDSITPYDPLPVGLILPSKHNSVTFDFAAIEQARPAQVRYQYILENYDRDWNPVTSQTTATFGNISEGSYIFKVKAQSPDGVWSDPVEYSFKVLPPFWRSGWFILLCTVIAGAILFFGIRYRVGFVRRKEQEKAKQEKHLLELEAKALRAQMNPHFIFNCMNSIKSLMQEREIDKGVTYLTTFSKLIRTLFNNADKKEISLYDEIETCKLYLQLEAMRFDAKFSYAVNVDEELDLKSILVPALIIQPFIENAIWHGIVPKGGGGNVSLSVLKNNSVVEIIIDDDGIGREASKLNKAASNIGHQSKGVNLTQSRLELDNLLQQRQASLETIDKKDADGKSAGTKVTIKILQEE